MKNANTNTQAQTATTNNYLEWNAGSIFSANFMFPTAHFQDAEKLERQDDDSFSDFIIGLLQAVGPLTDYEQRELSKSVFKNDRLRVYYQTLLVIEKKRGVVNETETLGCEDAKLSEQLDHHGFSIQTEEPELPPMPTE